VQLGRFTSQAAAAGKRGHSGAKHTARQRKLLWHGEEGSYGR
jgi:hypothetical protein